MKEQKLTLREIVVLVLALTLFVLITPALAGCQIGA